VFVAAAPVILAGIVRTLFHAGQNGGAAVYSILIVLAF